MADLGTESGPPLRRIAYAVAALTLLAAAVFSVFPGLDIAFSRLFVVGPYDGFLLNYPGPGPAIRFAFKALFWVGVVAGIAGLCLAALHGRRPLSLGFPKWLFVLACLAAGPGLLVNGILKDSWGRARPQQTRDFGGTQPFTPALRPAGNCRGNCSFVSGEASSPYALFFALALVAPQGAVVLLGAGLLAGTGAGLVRIAQGGHFLSDVVFAGLFMALVALALYWVMFRRYAGLFADDGPLHRKALALGAGLGKFAPAASTLIIGAAALVAVQKQVSDIRRAGHVNLAFDGTRALYIQTDLRTAAYTVDLILRSRAAPDLAALSEPEMPLVLSFSDARLVRYRDRYAFRIGGQPGIPLSGSPETWRRFTFSAREGGTARIFLNGRAVWSGRAPQPLYYSSFALGGRARSRHWHGDIYSFAVYEDAAREADFDPGDETPPAGGRLYLRRVNPAIPERPRIR